MDIAKVFGKPVEYIFSLRKKRSKFILRIQQRKLLSQAGLRQPMTGVLSFPIHPYTCTTTIDEK